MMDPEDMQSAIIELEAYAEEQEKRIDKLVLRVMNLEAYLKIEPNIENMMREKDTVAESIDGYIYHYPIDHVVCKPDDPRLHMTMFRDDEPRSPVRRFLDRLWQITGW